MDIEVGARRVEDDAAIRGLLEAADLPTRDLSPDLLQGFLVAREPEGHVVGAIGLEIFGRFGLLRSLVVDPAARGRGVGALLVEHLERSACAAGVTELYLLTTTAAGFFDRLGYRLLERALVPPEIAATMEFRSLCPAAAICQGKRLGQRGSES